MDAYENLALEEAIFQLFDDMIVRIWENERSVIIGRAQLAAYETDLDYCINKSIPVVRRFTGGGAVYNGPGNANWSIFIARRYEKVGFAWDVRGVFKMGSTIVINALRRLGIISWFDEPNRIVTAEGKISGMAAYLTRNKLLCHGTMLLNADLEEATRLTDPREYQLEARYVRSKKVKIANAGIELKELITSFRDTISSYFHNTEFKPDSYSSRLNGQELELARRLVETKYKDSSWNLSDPFLYQMKEN
jgi:lipoate-protein ligase A